MHPRSTWLLAALAVGCDAGSLLGPPARDRALPAPQLGATRRDPDTLIVARAADAVTLEPGRAWDDASIEVMEQIYDRLVQFRPGTNDLEPGLAVSWETADEGRVWTFALRPGVRFHDGAPLDADAVVFSFERQRDARHPHHSPEFTDWSNNLDYVQSVEAIAPDRVRITLERMYAPFLSDLAMSAVAIVSPRAVRERGDAFGGDPVGTGPFRVAAWHKGRRIVLERNDAYWGARPGLARVIFETIPDPRQRVVALESGAIDVAYSIPPADVQFVRLHPGLEVHQTAANNVSFLALNTARPPLDDVRVRRAINYAVNAEPIVKLAFQGMAIRAHGPLPPTQWGYDQPAEPYRHDPDRARALLAAARADGRFDPRRVLSLFVPPHQPQLPDPDEVARVIAANLRAVGVRTRIETRGQQAFWAAVRDAEHDMCLGVLVPDSPDPDSYLYAAFSRDNAEPGRSHNLSFFRDDEIYGLLVRARETDEHTDHAHRTERERAYHRIQQLLRIEAPWVPLAHSRRMVAARDDVADMVINPSGHVSYRRVRRSDTARSPRAPTPAGPP